MKKYLFIMLVLCLMLTLTSFIVSYYVMDKNISEKPNDASIENLDSENDKVNDENVYSMNKDEQYISPNTVIKYVLYYNECGHTLTKTEDPLDEFINMNKSQLEKYIENNLNGAYLVSFTNKEVIIKKEIDSLCPNHFIVGEINGKIAIYKINEDGERILDMIFENSSVKMLKDIDQQKLKKGIRVDNEEELTNVLENFIS